MREATHSSFQARQQHQRLIQKRETLRDTLCITSQQLQRYESDKTCLPESVACAFREEYEQATVQLCAVEKELAAPHATEARDNLVQKESSISLIKLADIVSQPVRWLWRDYIPLGKLTILDGDPGLGKSLFSLDLAARASKRHAMPDGTESDLTEPAGVVLLSLEDDPADTIRPRLEAAGANLDRILLLTAIKEDDEERMPTLFDLGALHHAIKAANAKLVIIDPFMAYLPGSVNSFRDQDIRRILAPLAQLAAATSVAVLVIRHLNKSEGRSPLYRGGGSIGIIGAARSGLLVAKDPEDDERRILAVSKSNLAKIPSALAYRVVAHTKEIPSLVWEGATAHTASSLLTYAPRKDTSALEEAQEFLRDTLRAGAVPAKEVQQRAEEAGIKLTTLRRAKTALKVVAHKRGGFFGDDEGETQHWCWMLPAGDASVPKDAQDIPEGIHTHEREHLQQSSEKNSRNFNGVPEDAQVPENEHLRYTDEHLSWWEKEL